MNMGGEFSIAITVIAFILYLFWANIRTKNDELKRTKDELRKTKDEQLAISRELTQIKENKDAWEAYLDDGLDVLLIKLTQPNLGAPVEQLLGKIGVVLFVQDATALRQ